MKSFTLTLVLAATVLAVVFAAPEPEPAKGGAIRYRAAEIVEDDVDEADMLSDVNDNKQVDAVGDDKKGDASSGRLFMKKFLLFKNMFGSNQKQPIIPIIITGGGGTGTATGTTAPTTTITTTGTVPTATATITTSDVTPDAGGDGGAVEGRRPVQRLQLVARGSYDNDAQEDDEAEEEAAGVDNQALAAALAAGAEEYVVTDQDIKGTSDSKARGPARVNLRRRGSKNGQVVSVRIPPKYRGYFQNGQRVILNNSNRPGKRRVIKKRVIRNRNRKVVNKRRRIVGKH